MYIEYYIFYYIYIISIMYIHKYIQYGRLILASGLLLNNKTSKSGVKCGMNSEPNSFSFIE